MNYKCTAALGSPHKAELTARVCSPSPSVVAGCQTHILTHIGYRRASACCSQLFVVAGRVGGPRGAVLLTAVTFQGGTGLWNEGEVHLAEGETDV